MHAPHPWARRTRVLAVSLAVVLGTEVVSLQFRSAPSAYSQTTSVPHTRVYFIAADEVRWNYAPAGRNLITGQPFGDAENVFVQQGPNRIGSGCAGT